MKVISHFRQKKTLKISEALLHSIINNLSFQPECKKALKDILAINKANTTEMEKVLDQEKQISEERVNFIFRYRT